jgi:hypothetical protein
MTRKWSFLRNFIWSWEGVKAQHFSRGDFNIVKSQKEKSNGMINFNIVSHFNDWIDRWPLIDLKDPSRTFTLTNNQNLPIMDTLDTIMLTTHWKSKYPLAKTSMLPKGISDHNPLMITFGEILGVILFLGLKSGDWKWKVLKTWWKTLGVEIAPYLTLLINDNSRWGSEEKN